MKKIVSIITVLVMVAITMTVYGLNYTSGIYDYADIIQDQIDAMTPGSVLRIEGGTFYCTKTIDLSNMPDDSTFECYGILKFPVGITGVYLSGRYKKVFIKKICNLQYDYSDYNTYTGAGIHIKDASVNNVEVGRITGFKDGFLLESNDSLGAYYNDITFSNIRQCHTAIRYKISGGGFINSNHWFGGAIHCWNGVIFDPAPNSLEVFNNNSFYNFGFEIIKDNVITLKLARGNSFYSPRFEGKPGALPENEWIKEDNTCRGNVFNLDMAVYYSKALTAQNGTESIVNGSIYDDSGRRVAYQKLNRGNVDDTIFLNTLGNSSWSLPNSYYFNNGDISYQP